MQFNVKITLNSTTTNRHGEKEISQPYPIKCTLMSFYRKPDEKLGGKSDISWMTVIIPYKKSAPYQTIADNTIAKNFVYNGTTFGVEKIDIIPSFSGKSKFFEVTLKEEVAQ